MNGKTNEKVHKLNVGENILYWRRLKGIKQEVLADMIGISSGALSNIENGVSKPDIARLEDIANALEIELNQLLTNPQQLFTFNNSPQSNGVIYGTNNQQNMDKELLHKLTTIMEKLTMFFTSKDRNS